MTSLVVKQTFDEAIPVARLHEHPDNPRRGRDDLVGDSIDTNGFYGGIIVHKRTRNVLAGNTRYRSMVAKGATTIPGFWVTCDDETAKRIMLADNRTSDMASYDDDVLAALLAEQEDLVGTGYTQSEFERIMAKLEPDDAPDDFPDLDPAAMTPTYRCPSCRYEWSGSQRPGLDDE